ncbi:MAG: methyltransferase domain-containing protein [Caldilinea sp.]|nr:methyltransferase domain-containing protein [Caldilinea sp.]MDW8439462.1 methyltransferase domain-containing protein [Caldilineaceae bacterium]
MKPSQNTSVKATVARRFGEVAQHYRTSAVHAAGEDLAQLVRIADLGGKEVVLDAGCGAGHTALALAPFAARVIAIDLSEAMLAQGQMLAEGRGLGNLTFVQGDVEALTYGDAAFDLTVSRYSAHHWPHPQQALRELHRVLRPGGRLLLGDIVSYDNFVIDTHLQTIELLRDPSHVRDHTIAQWLTMLTEAGFTAQVRLTWPLRLDFTSWTQRMATPPDAVAMLRKLLAHAPTEVQTHLQVEPDGSFTLQGALFEGVRP